MARKPIAEARREVAAAAAKIANLDALRGRVVANPDFAALARRGVPFGTLANINRRKNLTPFDSYITNVVLDALQAGDSEDSRQRKAADAAARAVATDIARSQGRTGISGVDVPAGVDRLFLDRRDGVDAIFRDIIFGDPKASDAWMRELDREVARSSEANIREIDLKDTQDEVAQFDVVIVGGGPLTAVAASLLGPGRRVTVVTQDRSIGFPWRSRPLYINSSAEDDLTGLRIPLLTGTTTPINGSQTGLLGANILTEAGQDFKNVTCDDQSTRKYVSGLELGKLVATNIAFQADDYIVNQTVDIAASRKVPGKKKTELVLREGNAERRIQANTVLVLSGPGQETLKGIDDAPSRNLYDTSTSIFKQNLTQVRERIAPLSAQLGEVRANRFIPSDERLREEERLKTEIRRLASGVVLPRVLTLSIVESLIDFWITDLERDPDVFPLKPLLQNGVKIGNIGGKDTSRTLIELLKGQGPKGAYPEGFNPAQLEENGPKFVLYNETAKNPAEYIDALRKRYQDLAFFAALGDLLFNPNKVDRFNLVNNQGEVGVKITDTKGGSEVFDYAFVATGFERPEYEKQLAGAFSFGVVNDLTGEPTILGDERTDFYIGGSATGFKKKDFPMAIRDIIDILGIPENTISLWVNALILERFLLSYLSKEGRGVNQAKADELLRSEFAREYVRARR